MKEIHEYLTRRNRFFATAAAIVGAILANFSGPILLKLVSLTATIAGAVSILKIVGNLLLASSIAIFLSISIKIARERGFTVKRAVPISLYLILSVTMVFMSYKMNELYGNFVRFITTESTNTRNKLNDKLGTVTTIEKKSKISHLIAQSVYEDEGRIVNYLEKDGSEHKYHPDNEAIKNREMVKLFQDISKTQNQTMMAIILIWITSTLLAVIIGVTRGTVIRSDT